MLTRGHHRLGEGSREERIAAAPGGGEAGCRRPADGANRPSKRYCRAAAGAPKYQRRIRSGSRRSRFVAVPVKGRPVETDRLLPRYKGIYHVGCTDYPNPTYP